MSSAPEGSPGRPAAGVDGGSWLVLVDLQRIFGEPGSDWFTPRFAEAVAGAARLRPAFGQRVALTRFLAPEKPAGAWIPYYQDWPFALDPANRALYDLVPDIPPLDARLIDRPTFGKWSAETRAALDDPREIVLAGVSTDCCVISTALAAADDGVRVRVVADACAGLSDVDHQRALDVMALYAPLISITSVDEILAERATIG
ncbi:nicotinamidase-related amidase [Cryobacterium sp. MP_M5]|uniref:cysteine hydrolase family protein n=1 Tax=unclassified Cryobacterium TaxID=2649013 RepID=UPI0018CB9FE8|nr:MULTISPECIES: cysteine hydrolase [unclassified Cryobacterium]MBG6059180.1 nicotinamidase-related amidase [Cryobacterium sp. MP_M3]MEC5177474.1 nicotinamidase-related amidase [Cryobacterium sp. MP_M5]